MELVEILQAVNQYADFSTAHPKMVGEDLAVRKQRATLGKLANMASEVFDSWILVEKIDDNNHVLQTPDGTWVRYHSEHGVERLALYQDASACTVQGTESVETDLVFSQVLHGLCAQYDPTMTPDLPPTTAQDAPICPDLPPWRVLTPSDPGKASLYRTARVATDTLLGFPQGTYVALLGYVPSLDAYDIADSLDPTRQRLGCALRSELSDYCL